MTASTRLLDDPAARVRRWRRKGSSVAANVVSILRQHPEINLARFELTEEETMVVTELASAGADRILDAAMAARKSADPNVRVAREQLRAERKKEEEFEIAVSKAKYNNPAFNLTYEPALDLTYRRKITWEKKDHDFYDVVTYGDDFRAADRGYRIEKILDEVEVDGNDDIYVEIEYNAPDDVGTVAMCGYAVIYRADTPDEQFLGEDGFKTMNEAWAAAEATLARLLKNAA